MHYASGASGQNADLLPSTPERLACRGPLFPPTESPLFETPLPYPRHQPICPIDQLPEPLLSAALYVITKKDVPAAVALTDALGAAGAIVHCGFDCQAPDGEVLPATINTCALAPTTCGKGRSYREFFKHFIRAHKVLTRQGRGKRVTGEASTTPPTPRVETLVSQTISFRRLMEVLDGDGMNMTLQCEDSASLLATDLFKKHLSALTQLWSGDPPLDLQVHRVNLVAADARWSIGFRIQPDLMYDHLDRHGRRECSVGWWPRSVVGCYDPERFPENESYQTPSGHYSPDNYHARMAVLASQINARYDSGDFTRTPIGLDINALTYMGALGHYLKEWKKTEYRDIDGAAGRAWENTLRIAVVLQVFCDRPGPVTLDMVKRAWAIMEWSLSQYRWAFVEAPPRYSDKAIAKAGAANKQRAKGWTARQSKPIKTPRTWQNADFILTCLNRTPFRNRLHQTVLLEDVFRLADMSRNRFDAALEWLKSSKEVEEFNHDGEIVLRRILHWTNR